MKKQVKETIRKVKTKIQEIDKIQTAGILEMENLGKKSGTRDMIISNRKEEMEERISGIQYLIEEIYSSANEQLMSIFLKETLLNSFYETTIILILKPHEDSKKKEYHRKVSTVKQIQKQSIKHLEIKFKNTSKRASTKIKCSSFPIFRHGSTYENQ